MVNLPATYFAGVEDQALAYAKKLVAWFRDKHWFSPHSVLSPEAAYAFAQQHLKQRALEHPNHMLRIKKAAEAGSEVAREALLDLANEYHGGHRGGGMPPSLADFQMQWNAKLIRKRKRGRDKVDNSLRNIAIATMVSELCAKFGLSPTRRSARRHSGCSIIADALRSELHGANPPGEKAIETICHECSSLIVPFSAVRIVL